MYGVSWFKTEMNIFENRKIMILLQEPKGDSYFRVWMQLIAIATQCRSGGKLLISENKPMTIHEFALIMGKSRVFMEKIINKFLELEMLIIENNTFILKNWSKYQSIDKYENVLEQNRKRQAKYREKLKSEKEKSNVIGMLDNAQEKKREDKDENKENIGEENTNGFKRYEL